MAVLSDCIHVHLMCGHVSMHVCMCMYTTGIFTEGQTSYHDFVQSVECLDDSKH